MSVLAPDAKAEIKESGLTLRDYARSIQWADNPDGQWFGDLCGCSDGRCVGYHHDWDEPCGCLPVLIRDAIAWKAISC